MNGMKRSRAKSLHSKVFYYIRQSIKLLLPCAIFLLPSCSGSKDYKEVIPSNVKALLQISSNKIPEIAHNLNFPSIPNIQQKLPSFAYITSEGYYALTIPMKDDADSVRMALQTSSKDFTARGQAKGLTWAWWKGSWLVMTSDKALSIIGPALGSDERGRLTGIAQQLYRNPEKGMTDGQLYTILFQNDTEPAEWKLVAQISALPILLQQLFMSVVLPQDLKNEESVIVSYPSANSSGGEIVINNKIQALHSERQAFFEKTAQKSRKIQSGHSSVRGSFLSLYANIKGAELWENLKDIKSVKIMLMGLSDVIDIKNILTSIDGDVTISLAPLTNGLEEMPSFFLKADCKDASFVKQIPKWERQIKKKKGQSACRIQNYYCFRFGIKGEKYLLLLPPESSKSQTLTLAYGQSKNLDTDFQMIKDESESQVKAKGLTYLVNINSEKYNNEEGASAVGKIMSLFGTQKHRIEIKAPDALHSTIKAQH